MNKHILNEVESTTTRLLFWDFSKCERVPRNWIFARVWTTTLLPVMSLHTCSIVAINVDTGKMAWYYQFNPHDTHDWDSTESPALIDGEFKGNGGTWVCMQS
jgi:glucose dehydrogenase